MKCLMPITNSSTTTAVVVAFPPGKNYEWRTIAGAGFIVCRIAFPPDALLWIPCYKNEYRHHPLREYFDGVIAEHVSKHYVPFPVKVDNSRNVLTVRGLDEISEREKESKEEAPFLRLVGEIEDVWSGIYLHQPEMPATCLEFAVCDNYDSKMVFCKTESGWQGWSVEFHSGDDNNIKVFGSIQKAFGFPFPAVIAVRSGIRLHRFTVERESAIVAISLLYEQYGAGTSYLLSVIEEFAKREGVLQALYGNKMGEIYCVDELSPDTCI